MFKETQAKYRTDKENEVVEIIELKQVRVGRTDWETIMSSQQLGMELIDEIGSNRQETFMIFGLNTRNAINFLAKVFVVGANNVAIESRQIFQKLLLANCKSFIIAHNHPSGDVSPSRKDLKVARDLKKCGETLGIELLDSLIISKYTYFSMAEKELL